MVLNRKVTCRGCGESYPPGWPHECNSREYHNLLADFDNFKRLCPWTDQSGESCMAISCTGWGGKDCEPKNCGLLHLVSYLKTNFCIG